MKLIKIFSISVLVAGGLYFVVTKYFAIQQKPLSELSASELSQVDLSKLNANELSQLKNITEYQAEKLQDMGKLHGTSVCAAIINGARTKEEINSYLGPIAARDQDFINNILKQSKDNPVQIVFRVSALEPLMNCALDNNNFILGTNLFSANPQY